MENDINQIMKGDPYLKSRIYDRYVAYDHRYVNGTYEEKGLKALLEYKKKFPFYENIVWRYYAPNHRQRYMLIKDQFKNYFDGALADIGTRENVLSEIIGKPVALVDKNNPNLPSFDWDKEELPFADNSFDTVVCLDTLEHISDIHKCFHDLIRISKRYIIVSLPNNWRRMVKGIIKGYGNSVAYGIPLIRPMDRHRWFFNTEEAENFFYYNAAVSHPPVDVRQVRYYIPTTIPRHRVIYPLLRWLLPLSHFENFVAHTIFMVFEKQKP
jgi:hypothetical protein